MIAFHLITFFAICWLPFQEAMSKDEKERKALRTIALLLVTFAICWLPLSFVFVLTAVKPGYLNDW